MASGLPAATGDVLTAATVNGLVTFTINTQSGSTYTVANTDLYQVLVMTGAAGTKTVTIAPDSTLTSAASGSTITFLNTGAGLATFAAGSGVTIVSGGSTSSAPTLAQYKTCVAIRVASNTWYVAGAIA
jgi:uncharacterized MnhB-related membrane protein